MNRFASAALALTVLAATAGCMSAPSNLDLSLTRPTVDNNPTGAPIPGARFAVDGGMPQHGHGLPTQPRVTREVAAGTYQLDGMKFSMTGWWEIKLAIDSPEGVDKVTFNTVVAEAAAGR